MSITKHQTTQTKPNSPSPSTVQRKPSTRPSSLVSQKRTGTQKRSNGKSKYAQKSRVNANKKAVVAKPRGPVYAYTSACCSLPARKKACVAVGKKDALTQSLGKFRCSGCGKRSKVTVSKYVAPVAGEYTADSLKVLENMPPATPTVMTAVTEVPVA